MKGTDTMLVPFFMPKTCANLYKNLCVTCAGLVFDFEGGTYK